MKIHILFLASIFLFANFQKKTLDEPIELDLDKIFKKVNSKADTSILTDINYVFLETKEECLIGGFILDVRYSDGLFYINDLRGPHSIFVFNDKGTFQYKISKYGRGPGEYSNADNFDIDSSGDIYVLDNVLSQNKNRLIKYSKRGKEYSEINLGYKIGNFMILDENRILVTDPFDTDQINFSIGELNIKDKSIKEIFPYRLPFDNATIHFGPGPEYSGP